MVSVAHIRGKSWLTQAKSSQVYLRAFLNILGLFSCKSNLCLCHPLPHFSGLQHVCEEVGQVAWLGWVLNRQE